ncbi:MAG: hypothetical protein AAF203_06610 [Pseudomonadota bacterium]
MKLVLVRFLFIVIGTFFLSLPWQASAALQCRDVFYSNVVSLDAFRPSAPTSAQRPGRVRRGTGDATAFGPWRIMRDDARREVQDSKPDLEEFFGHTPEWPQVVPGQEQLAVTRFNTDEADSQLIVDLFNNVMVMHDIRFIRAPQIAVVYYTNNGETTTKHHFHIQLSADNVNPLDVDSPHLFTPSADKAKDFFEQMLTESSVDPESIQYIEVFITRPAMLRPILKDDVENVAGSLATVFRENGVPVPLTSLISIGPEIELGFRFTLNP